MSTATMDDERRISFSQAEYARLDEYIADVRGHALAGMHDEHPNDTLLAIMKDCCSLYSTLKLGVIE